MAWFKVDDKLHEHGKGRKAGKSAMGVWVLAGSYCADNLTNGFVARRVLGRWGTPRDAKALVEAGLWLAGEHDGEPGWWFHDWDKFQPCRDKVLADREAAKERMRAIRSGERSGERAANVHDPGVHDPVPSRPVLVVTTPSQSPTQRLSEDGLTRIQQALNNCPAPWAERVVDDVLAKSAGEVRDPVRYVLRAISKEPEFYRYSRGNPTRATECPDHAGEWADACRACAIDKRLGGSA